jgi:hypothetical protein
MPRADELFAKFYSELETEARNRDAAQAQINGQNASWPLEPFPTMPQPKASPAIDG